MILLVAIVFGFMAGLIRAWAKKSPYRPPHLEHVWMVFLAYLPQFFAFYLPVTRTLFPDAWVPATLICSQLLLLIFVWLNRIQPGFWLLGIGLALNLLVIALNGGMMPLSPENASKLIPPGVDVLLQIGQRVGHGKDIFLPIEQTRLWFLSDYFTLPQWINYRLAFSIGDIVISTGAFWLFWSLGKSRNSSMEE
jgi:hypothetical protein